MCLREVVKTRMAISESSRIRSSRFWQFFFRKLWRKEMALYILRCLRGMGMADKLCVSMDRRDTGYTIVVLLFSLLFIFPREY